MGQPFLTLLLSNSPPLTSGLQPSGRGQQTPIGSAANNHRREIYKVNHRFPLPASRFVD